jgi:hypothetical protein
MSEAEKQESQKTVVAFITGLLIGGLLVWVFSSTPDEKKKPEEKTTDTEQVTTTEDVTDAETIEKAEVKVSEVTGKGSLTVVDQKAGKVVTLGKTEFPSKKGWVVVRDYMDGTPGNVIGAARYAGEEGLVPTAVELVRETVAGSSYQVSFYNDIGDAGFSSAEDTQIDGATATFKAN